MAKPLSAMTDAELIAAYNEYARLWGEASLVGNVPRVNKMVPKLIAVSNEMKERGPAVRMMLEPFMDSSDIGVRYQAAYELLALVPDRSRAILTAISEARILGLSLGAGMTLLSIDRGTFVPT